ASQLAAQGAELAFSYQGEALLKRVKPLAESVGSDIMIECDVTTENGVADAFATLKEHWNSIDFVVHAIGFSDKNELKGKYMDTSRANFNLTMDVSCYSFTEV